jgi:RNase P protein component
MERGEVPTLIEGGTGSKIVGLAVDRNGIKRLKRIEVDQEPRFVKNFQGNCICFIWGDVQEEDEEEMDFSKVTTQLKVGTTLKSCFLVTDNS